MSTQNEIQEIKYQLNLSGKGLVGSTTDQETISSTAQQAEQVARPFTRKFIANQEWEKGAGKIENFIGYCHIPVGQLKNLLVNGDFTAGNYDLPLATTEGALVASYQRGAKAANLAGGVQSFCIAEGVQRAPLFILRSIQDSLLLKEWINNQQTTFQAITSEISNYAQLQKIIFQEEANRLIVLFEFTTGEAAGQNMVTFCTDAICKYIRAEAPVYIDEFYIESNYGGDKKPNSRAMQGVRGKKVIAEVTIPEAIVQSVLKCDSQRMAKYFWNQTVAANLSGAQGIQGHFANGLAALFLATGQDIACVAEAAQGISRIEAVPGGLYCAVTLPNLICGTVGGGTNLATAQAGLQMMDCQGPNSAKRYAELAAALVLCGEISITAAMAAGHFTRAHKTLGRKEGENG